VHLYVQWRKTIDCDIKTFKVKCRFKIFRHNNVFSSIIAEINPKTLFEFDLTTNESTGATLKKK
jgi:hypothetical protein